MFDFITSQLDRMSGGVINEGDGGSGIYKITCTSGRYYIGSTSNFTKRVGSHKSALRNNSHSNPVLQSSWNKYGPDSLVFELVDLCPQGKLLEIEQEWLNVCMKFPNCMNIAKTAVVPTERRELSDRHKAKMSDARLGRPRGPQTPEWREKCRLARIGQKRSPEARANMSAVQKSLAHLKRGQPSWERTPESRANLVEAFKLRPPPSAETRAKIAATLTGRKLGPRSEGTKQKISVAQKGRPKTERQRLAIQYKAVDLISEEGAVLQSFRSVNEAAVTLNVQASSVSAVCNGRRRTTGGLRFQFSVREEI